MLEPDSFNLSEPRRVTADITNHHSSGATDSPDAHRDQCHRVTGTTPQRLTLDSSPTLQPLEPRLLLTAYIVDSLLDVVADDGFITLREAIVASNTNSAPTADVLPGSSTETDTITFDPALTASGPAVITLNGTELTITDSLDITGPGQELLNIDANGKSRIFFIFKRDAEIEIRDLSITGGYEQDGGAIRNGDGILTLNNITLMENIARFSGGAIKNEGITTLNNTTIKKNVSQFGKGGGISSDNSLTHNRISLTLNHCTIIDNIAEHGGGGINGGYSTDTIVSIKDSLISGNSADSGGGIYNDCILIITETTIEYNTTVGNGGAIHNTGTLTASNLVIQENSATNGGGLFNSSSKNVVISNALLKNNQATAKGGGIYNNKENISLVNISLIGNITGEYGGGIFNSFYASFAMSNSVVEGNSAQRGGGIYSENFTTENISTITNSTIVGNLALIYGGGIFNKGNMTLTNSTVTANTVGYYGGGIFNDYLCTLNNSIVVNNNAIVYSEVYGNSINNSSLIGGNPQFLHNPSDGGDGWIDDPDTPDIDESANNDYGDLRLQSNSPAINAGDNTLLPVDEFDLDNDGDTTELLPLDLANMPRIIDGIVDIGAYENTDTLIPGDTNLDNKVDLVDLVTLGENYNQPGQWAQGDFNGDNFVDLVDLVTLGENYNTSAPLTLADQPIEQTATQSPDPAFFFTPTLNYELATLKSLPTVAQTLDLLDDTDEDPAALFC